MLQSSLPLASQCAQRNSLQMTLSGAHRNSLQMTPPNPRNSLQMNIASAGLVGQRNSLQMNLTPPGQRSSLHMNVTPPSQKSSRNSLQMSITPPGICSSRSPLAEDYGSNYSSTLPRTRLSGLTRLQENELDMCGNAGGISGLKSGIGGLKGNSERFNMTGETKGNPKYVIRTRLSDSKDESFV